MDNLEVLTQSEHNSEWERAATQELLSKRIKIRSLNFMRGRAFLNAAGTTIILTTHYLEEAENLCRHVAVIDKGRIIENDRMSRVLRKLQTEVFVLNLRHPIASQPVLPGYRLSMPDDHTLEIEVSKEQSLNDIFSRLTGAGIEVLSMRNKTNRLEELFMRLVEQQAPAAAQAASAL